MNVENARRLAAELPPTALVVDVGGGASPFPRADHVLDAICFEQRAALGEMEVAGARRYSKETWHQLDLCDHRPWPFPDEFFDFAVCSHLLEDVRDPLWICHEMCRVAKAGYVEFPSRVVEQSLGVEHPCYAGYHHHRWLISKTAAGLEFRLKPHCLHAVNDAVVARVGVWRVINPNHAIETLEWQNGFDYREVLEFDEERVIEDLCAFARWARLLPELTIRSDRPWMQRFKRGLYFSRLKRGRR